MLLLVAASATAFSSQSLGYFDTSLSRGSVKSCVAPRQEIKQPVSSTRLCVRSTQNDENRCSKSMEHESILTGLTSGSKKAATIVSLALIASASSAAFPALAHAVDLDSMYGGAMTVASATSGLMAKISDSGFYQAFSLVFVSEIGDKTFFIAGLLSMKTSKLTSFLGSMGALSAMTVLSVLIGQIFHAVPSGFGDGIPLDDIAACLAFTFFGLKTLKDALDMEEGDSVMDEELAEAEEEVENSDSVSKTTAWGQLASIFALVFAAEFGDRSFLSTIALSAAQNPVSVGVGAIAAHGVATGIAVSGGSYLAKYISERVIGIIGGSLFLVFAATTALGIF